MISVSRFGEHLPHKLKLLFEAHFEGAHLAEEGQRLFSASDAAFLEIGHVLSNYEVDCWQQDHPEFVDFHELLEYFQHLLVAGGDVGGVLRGAGHLRAEIELADGCHLIVDPAGYDGRESLEYFIGVLVKGVRCLSDFRVVECLQNGLDELQAVPA